MIFIFYKDLLFTIQNWYAIYLKMTLFDIFINITYRNSIHCYFLVYVKFLRNLFRVSRGVSENTEAIHVKSHNEVTPFIDSARKSMKGNAEGESSHYKVLPQYLIDEVFTGRILLL